MVAKRFNKYHKSYDSYDIKEGDIIYYKYGKYYSQIVELTNYCMYGIYLMNNHKCYEYEHIQNLYILDCIKIYRKRLQPSSCNIV